MLNCELLSKMINDVKEESSAAVDLSNALIKEFCSDLDQTIAELDQIIDSIGTMSIDDIPDSQLEYYCVKIPALMYYAGQGVESLGLQSDLAANSKKSALNDAMMKVSGTAQTKKAIAEQLTEDKALVELIYRRAHNNLKLKLELAEKVYSGLKKAMTKRISESDLNRYSQNTN